MMTTSLPYHRAILQAEFQRRSAKNSRYSARAFARSLGVHPSTLCRVMSGKQGLSLRLCTQIAGSLKLQPPTEREFIASVAGEGATPSLGALG